MEEFSADVLKSSIRTEIIGREILLYGEVSSTQDIARGLSLKIAKEGTVIMAECQSKGRGRLGRGWFSPRGTGLWASIILHPRESYNINVVSLTCALSIAKAVRKVSGLECLVKWPNDVVIGGRKFAGVLVEVSGKMVVLGVGMNVNIDGDNFPNALRKSATSLMIELGREVSRVSLMREFLQQFDGYYSLLLKRGFLPILEELKDISYVLRRQVAVCFNGKEIEGEAIDIDEEGALIIRLDSGIQKRVRTGDLRI